MTRQIELQTENGPKIGTFFSGRGFPAADSETPKPSVIVLHEWWGLNDDIREITGEFAEAGFDALAVDLYGAEATSSPMRAMSRAKEMKTADSMVIVKGAMAWLRAQTASNGKVGIVGFCLGGAQALAAASTLSDVDAAVAFYGLARADYMLPERVTAPIQGHFAIRDEHIDAGKRDQFFRALEERKHDAILHLYDAEHAFVRPGHGGYSAELRRLSLERTVEFLHQRLDQAS